MKYFNFLLLLAQLGFVTSCASTFSLTQKQQIIQQLKQKNIIVQMQEHIKVQTFPFTSIKLIQNQSRVYNQCSEKDHCRQNNLDNSIPLNTFHLEQLDINLLISKQLKDTLTRPEFFALKNNQIFNLLTLQLEKQYSDYFHGKAMPVIVNLHLIRGSEWAFSTQTYYHFNKVEFDSAFSISSFSDQAIQDKIVNEGLVNALIEGFSRLAHEMCHIGLISIFRDNPLFSGTNTLNHEAYSEVYKSIYQIRAMESYARFIHAQFQLSYQLPDSLSSVVGGSLTLSQQLLQQLEKIVKFQIKFPLKEINFYQIGMLNYLLLVDQLTITLQDQRLIEQVDQRLIQLFDHPIDLEKYTVLNEEI